MSEFLNKVWNWLCKNWTWFGLPGGLILLIKYVPKIINMVWNATSMFAISIVDVFPEPLNYILIFGVFITILWWLVSLLKILWEMIPGN